MIPGIRKLLQKRGFTLIELLIVIAIILILVAIAVPNFVNARTRSQVTRVKGDIKSVATALYAYHGFYNRMLNGCGYMDPEASGPNPSWPGADNCPYGALAYTSGTTTFADMGHQLTSPNKFIGEIPMDPFGSAQLQDDAGTFEVSYLYYGRWKGTSTFGGSIWGIRLNKDRFILQSYGPDLQHFGYSPSGPPGGSLYDPTNGTNSYGDIFYLSTTGFADVNNDPNAMTF